jgi:hypothetical protein
VYLPKSRSSSSSFCRRSSCAHRTSHETGSVSLPASPHVRRQAPNPCRRWAWTPP